MSENDRQRAERAEAKLERVREALGSRWHPQDVIDRIEDAVNSDEANQP